MWYVGLFEQTGIMAAPWVEAGYRALCVDIDVEAGERDGVVFECADLLDWIPPRHLIEDGVVFTAAFPPCDDIARSGARWFKSKGLAGLLRAIELFDRAVFWTGYLGAPYIIENPVGTMGTYWRPPDHQFHPFDFTGFAPEDAYTKRTCLWVGNGFVMPKPKHAPDFDVEDVDTTRIVNVPDSNPRKLRRSATPPGFARAVFETNRPKETVDG